MSEGIAREQKIDMDDKWERTYWCGQLVCSERELRDAVAAVGNKPECVSEYLIARRLKGRPVPLAYGPRSPRDSLG